jgi:hypothetical protein
VTPPAPSDPPDQERDTPMTTTYLRVVILEAAIVAALWFFGRAFS